MVKIQLELRAQDGKITLKSSGNVKKANQIESVLVNGLMPLIKGYLQAASQQLEQNARAQHTTNELIKPPIDAKSPSGGIILPGNFQRPADGQGEPKAG